MIPPCGATRALLWLCKWESAGFAAAVGWRENLLEGQVALQQLHHKGVSSLHWRTWACPGTRVSAGTGLASSRSPGIFGGTAHTRGHPALRSNHPICPGDQTQVAIHLGERGTCVPVVFLTLLCHQGPLQPQGYTRLGLTAVLGEVALTVRGGVCGSQRD